MNRWSASAVTRRMASIEAARGAEGGRVFCADVFLLPSVVEVAVVWAVALLAVPVAVPAAVVADAVAVALAAVVTRVELLMAPRRWPQSNWWV